MIFNEIKRSALPDTAFGIPEDRKYPLDTREHVSSAIKLFGHAEESKKPALARRIKSAADKYGIQISKNTQVYKYLNYKKIQEVTGPDPNVGTAKHLLDKTSQARIFLTSDWHLLKNHYKKEKNLVNTSDIISWCMNNIKDDDVFMYLGDISFRWINEKDAKIVEDKFSKLPGHKILILGNHDIAAGPDFYNNCGFDYVFEELEYNNIVFSHRPIDMRDDPDKLNIHGHIHDIRSYNTTDGQRNVNVYPCFYDNKPTTLKYVLGHVDELTKDNVRSNIIGSSEAYVDPEYYGIINECDTMINDIIHGTIKEWSMAAFNPIPTAVKPYVLKSTNDSGSLIDAKKYALAADIIADKYLIINEDCHLEIVDSSYFRECNVEVYEYVGNRSNVGKIAKAYKNQDIVDESFIYSTLTNKPLLSDDQIDFDESFVKVDFDLMGEKNNSIVNSIQEQWNEVNGNSYTLPVFESFIRNDKTIRLKDYMSLREDANGYYVYDNHKHTRTRSVNRIADITPNMIASI